MLDASSLVGAIIKVDSTPERVVLSIVRDERIALSAPVFAEYSDVLRPPKIAKLTSEERRDRFLQLVLDRAAWYKPDVAVMDCRDAKDNKYLELSLAARATTLISSDQDLLVLHPWRGLPILSPAAFLSSR